MKKVLLCLLISILLVVSINISTNNQKEENFLKLKKVLLQCKVKKKLNLK